MTFEDRLSQESFSDEVKSALLRGVERDELDLIVSGSPNPEQRILDRMNAIGHLRGVGFIVSGGRQGGKIYQVTGWEDPALRPPKETIDDWSPYDREDLREIQRLPSAANPDWLSQHVGEGREGDRLLVHENSVLKVLTYDLVTHKGYQVETSHGTGIIVQKNVSRPSFQIINFSLSVEDLVILTRRLARLSYRYVQIIDLDMSSAVSLRNTIGGSIQKSAQAIYNVADLIAIKGRSSKSRKNIRRVGNTTEVHRLYEGGNDRVQDILEAWRLTEQSKHRALAIKRDYLAYQTDLPSKITTLGIRNHAPVSCQIFDRMTGTSCAAQIVEKALNFRSQPEGMPSTSDFSLWVSAAILQQAGITSINAGRIHGGSKGLVEHKRKLMAREIYEYTFLTQMRREAS